MNTLTINPYLLKSSPTLTSSRPKEKCLNESVNESEKNYVTKTANKYEIKREPAEINFCGFFSPEKVNKFYQSPKLHSILKFAKDQQIVFSAAFALILTCGLRPASIILLPSKKNKEDQKYASAHSIASGVIGLAISTIAFAPISSAINKFSDNAKDYLNKDSYLLKGETAKNNLKTLKVCFGRLPDIIPAIPKGILTVALIPPILKYVFGIEKKKADTTKNKTLPNVDYSLLNFQSGNKQKNVTFQNFKGGVN